MVSPDPPIPHAQGILERAHTPDTAATHYNERIVKRPLYLRPSSPTPSARALRRRALNDKKQAAQKRAKLRPRPLSAARKRALGIHQVPKEQQKYAIYEPLHDLWIGYMRDVLGISDAESGKAYVAAGSSGQLLASADMHGALLTVIRSRCVSRVGVTGIVVQDTKFTFDLITKQNAIKSIPKEHTTFRFEISLPTKPQDTTTNTAETSDEKTTTITTTKTSQTEPSPPPKPLIFDINGTSFQSRAPDRANKKFRIHYQPDI